MWFIEVYLLGPSFTDEVRIERGLDALGRPYLAEACESGYGIFHVSIRFYLSFTPSMFSERATIHLNQCASSCDLTSTSHHDE